MEYYVVSPNIFNDGSDYSEEMYKKGIVAVGWSADDKKGGEFKKIKEGDCVIVAQRQNWAWKYSYMGIVSENVNEPKLGEIEKKLSPIISLKNMDLYFENWSSNGSKQIPAIQRIISNENKIIIDKINCIISVNKYIDILKSNHNLILTGAPGTGKTYLAKQIAQQIIFGEVKEKLTAEEQKQFNEQCGFVQFHPSYDYTDFVEGLRPVQEENGTIGFELKDGVFKEFCKRALSNYLKSKISEKDLKTKDDFDYCYAELLRKIDDGEITEYETTKGPLPLSLTKKGQIEFSQVSKRKKYTQKVYLEKLFENLKETKEYDKILKMSREDIDAIVGNTTSIQHVDYIQYRWTLAELMKIFDDYKNKKTGEDEEKTFKEKSYVFIIDEINRGEISKIFGELFFSIDPGYRGIDGKVKTQYQNMIEEGDEFYDGFYVPKNVYIIGTMNDIDRSVESMDFAFRRRFAFKEIKANENVGMLDEFDADLKEKILNRMKHLNAAIEQIEGLSSAYHIGASYFLKLKNYNNDFNQLWANHIEGLLREYLRGMTAVEEKMEDLKNAFFEDTKR